MSVFLSAEKERESENQYSMKNYPIQGTYIARRLGIFAPKCETRVNGHTWQVYGQEFMHLSIAKTREADLFIYPIYISYHLQFIILDKRIQMIMA